MTKLTPILAETFEGRDSRYMSWFKRAGEYVLSYDCDPNYGG